MERMFRVLWYVFLFMFMSASGGFAFQCNSTVVAEGDTKGKVLSECGSPTSKEMYKVVNRETRQRKTIKGGEIWYYNRGASDFIYALTFENGVLVKIETQGRGR